ncbi:hypothetical protein BD626DRAFT_474563 [Schizophyllum amplum]|uniref:DUF6534 domain-containing protein n=1 Tax=Schizophyllum amplum TaxID=97359 RepID=A0A550CXQ1_9AGAR|nr:hypothetical protein BD626DRAFT_474563 [Auriculariopsis ampla]
MSDAVDVPKTYGAVLLGGLFSAWLGGMVSAQTVVYIKLYWKRDSTKLKSLVGAVWFLDALHSMAVWVAAWYYFIDHFSAAEGIARIPWSIAMTVVFTALVIFLVHLFLARRIHLLSHGNYYLSASVTVLAVLRLMSACLTTGTMFHYGTFKDFRDHFSWVFTLGLALSSAVDILITCCLFVLLHQTRTSMHMPGLTSVLDTLILYAFESGSLTCVATVVSMLCWITMNYNLIFLGLHFVIAKLYANTFLATLNMRYMIRDSGRGSSAGNPGIIVLESRRPGHDGGSHEMQSGKVNALQISVGVERSVQYDEDEDERERDRK